MSAVLARYPAEIVQAVTDPYSGLPSRKKENGYSGLPDVADVKEACEAEATRRARLAEYAALPKPSFKRLPPPPKGPGAFATIFVHPEAPQYEGFVERAKTADPREWRRDEKRPGIWVSMTWFDTPSPATKKGFKPFTKEELQKLYPHVKPMEAEPEIPF